MKTMSPMAHGIRLAFRGYPLGGCPVSPQRFKGATAERHFRRGYHNRTEEECKS